MEMNVNELDIGKVQPGQTVEGTAAALPGEVFTGTVERVSINGTTTSGFTTYPVTVVIEDYGDLKPGMNVSAAIRCETAEGAVSVPVGAVSRADSRLIRAVSSWLRLAWDSTVHSTSPLATLLPTSLVKPVTVPEPEAYTVEEAAMEMEALP